MKKTILICLALIVMFAATAFALPPLPREASGIDNRLTSCSAAGMSPLWDGTIFACTSGTGFAYYNAGVLGYLTGASARSAMGLAIGTDVQAYSANLATYASIAPSANVQTLLASANFAAFISSLGLTVGTNTQAYSSLLTALSGLTPEAGKPIVGNGSTFVMAANALTTDNATANHMLKKDSSGYVANAADGTDYISPNTNVYDYDFISIKYMDDGATAPSALAAGAATNKIQTRAFSGTADNDVFFDWKYPYGADSSVAIEYRVIYIINSSTVPDETANSNAGEAAVWSLAGTVIRSGIDTQDVTLGTAVTLTTNMGSVSAAWAASSSYTVNTFRIPTSGNINGYYYKCTAAGTSGGTEPAWPTTVGATVTDGGAVWTNMGYNANAQYTLIKSAWSGNLTVTNAAADKFAVFNLKRLASSNSSDNYAQALGVLGIEIRYARKLQVQ